MGDAGEGLIDQDSRIQERMEELERARHAPQSERRDPEQVRVDAAPARTELEAQLAATGHERRRQTPSDRRSIADTEVSGAGV
jgi:hypothetical protein